MMTPDQQRAALLYLIDESNEVKRWGAMPESTEDEPVFYVEVYPHGE